MRLGLSAALLPYALLFLSAAPAGAQTFEERWRIIPPANAAEPPPAPAPQPESQDNKPQEEAAPPAASSSHQPPQQQQRVERAPDSVLFGKASFYAYRRGKTASGQPYDRSKFTAASRTLPLGTKLRVTDLKTNKSVDVTVTDRGPLSKQIMLDLSLGAAHALGIGKRGIIDVQAEIIG